MNIHRVSVSPLDSRGSLSDHSSPATTTAPPKWQGVRAALRPLIFFSRTWAMAPFTIDPSGPPKPTALLFSILFVITLAVIHVVAVVYKFKRPSYPHILFVTTLGVMMFNRICALLNHVFLLASRSTLISAVSGILALDDEWHPEGSKRLRTLVNLELGGVLACMVTEASLTIYRDFGEEAFVYLMDIFVEVAVIASLSLLVLQWTNLVLSLAYHMDALILELNKLYPSTDDSFFMSRKPPAKNNWRLLLIENELGQGVRRVNNQQQKSQSPAISIQSLRRLHRDIHSVLQKLQAAYGGPLTIGFSVAIINTVMAVFDLRYRVDAKSIMWVTWCAVTTYLMVMPCQMLLDKTQKCADDLHGAMQNDIRQEERKQLLDFSVQLLDLPLTCSSCNFFLLDNRKLISVLGTIVTYVIILSQFDSSNKGNRLGATNTTNCTSEEV